MFGSLVNALNRLREAISSHKDEVKAQTVQLTRIADALESSAEVEIPDEIGEKADAIKAGLKGSADSLNAAVDAAPEGDGP